MIYRGLGADDQESAGLFIRWFAPTDFDVAQKRIAKLILDKTSWDLVSPTAWRVVGFDASAVKTWLERYIFLARRERKELSGNESLFKNLFISEYGYSEADINLYVDAFKSASSAGYITEIIRRPWGYEPETPADVVSSVVKKSMLPVGILAVAAVAAYAFFSRGLPRYAASRVSPV